jgi:hypothetical protein
MPALQATEHDLDPVKRTFSNLSAHHAELRYYRSGTRNHTLERLSKLFSAIRMTRLTEVHPKCDTEVIWSPVAQSSAAHAASMEAWKSLVVSHALPAEV